MSRDAVAFLSGRPGKAGSASYSALRRRRTRHLKQPTLEGGRREAFATLCACPARGSSGNAPRLRALFARATEAEHDFLPAALW